MLCLQVIFTLPRYPKTIAYPGPQGYGISPRFSEISIVVPNQFPNAICRSIRARATANAGGKCANPLSAADSSINAGSYDPDFAEYDSASLQYVRIFPFPINGQFISRNLINSIGSVCEIDRLATFLHVIHVFIIYLQFRIYKNTEL